MSKHTPGPWSVVPCSHGGMLLKRGDYNHRQSSLQIVPDEDARLIAAAPELLEVAMKYLHYFENHAITNASTSLDYTGDVAQAARAAIAKATGAE